jgi:hypothetical protein
MYAIEIGSLMAEKFQRCVVCGARLDDLEGEGPGRPRRYCSEGCRRAREYEIRTVVRAIDRAEDRAQALRFELDFAEDSDSYADERRNRRRRRQKKVEWWQGEVERLRGRLRQMLGADLG